MPHPSQTWQTMERFNEHPTIKNNNLKATKERTYERVNQMDQTKHIITVNIQTYKPLGQHIKPTQNG